MTNENNTHEEQDDWIYEEGEKIYPQGHFENLSQEEQEKFFACFDKLRNLSKEEKVAYLKNRKYAFWVLASLDGHTFESATFSQIAYHVTYVTAIGRRISKRDRAITDTMLKKIIPMLVTKGQIAFRGGYYSLTKEGERVLRAYRGGNAIYEVIIHSTDRAIAYRVVNNLAFKFYCEHNVKSQANPFRDNEEAEKVGMQALSHLEGISGILIPYDGFKEMGVTDEPMYYIEADIFMHFKKLMALRMLKADSEK